MAGAARDKAEQGHQCLEAEYQKLCSACGDEFPSSLHYAFILLLCLVVNQLFSLVLRVRALSDQEEKAAANQKVLEIGDQLVALIASGQALYDIMLSASQGDAELVLRLDEALLQVDPLILEGVHCSIVGIS